MYNVLCVLPVFGTIAWLRPSVCRCTVYLADVSQWCLDAKMGVAFLVAMREKIYSFA